MTPRSQAVGRFGERRAARWYTDRGYEVVARNWRVREGELDLVLTRGRVLVICEVKTRTSTRFGDGFAAVTRTKQVRIRHLATLFLREWQGARPAQIRFDVASVTPTSVEVIEEAF
ncbi:MAG: putative endonuclease [Candidatus Poriferisodalaceae bacterium]